MNNYQKTAKGAAFKDIAEECKRQKKGQNYVVFEKDICESLGIPAPDFRQYNGGHNKKRKAMMIHDQFVELVAQMRRNQKEFFKTRKKEYLDEAKRLEKQVDKEIENYEEESLF